MQQSEHVGPTEETFMRMLHVGVVNLDVFVMAGAAVLTFAFGLKSVFLGKRYKVLAFDMQDIDELKT